MIDPKHTNPDSALKTVFVGNRATEMHFKKSKLVVIEGVDIGKEYIIGKERVVVGRSKINDMALADQLISNCHFEVTATDKGHILKDLDSTNGTFLGEIRIREAFLAFGNIFRVGNSKIKFVPTNEIVTIQLSNSDRFDNIIGASIKMREIFAILEKVAPSNLTVLIGGETGTGKEVIAKATHNHSPRKNRPFIVQDCSAIPRELIESILFGHEKGSFTGAVSQHKGCFEVANGGTIFLDEIGELDITMQPKLLRVLENREIKRVGSDKTVKVDVRVLAASNRDLKEMVIAKSFREDLYFRLSVIQVNIPPLRNRKEDIPLLTEHFIKEFRQQNNRPRLKLAPDAMEALMKQEWPGNVRELKNMIERAASLCEGDVLSRHDFVTQRIHKKEGNLFEFDDNMSYKEEKQKILDRFEREFLKEVMQRNNNNISRSAAQVGLTRYHLRELIKKHKLIDGNLDDSID